MSFATSPKGGSSFEWEDIGPTMATRKTIFRGLPLSLFEEFLKELGGREEGGAWVGEGWRLTYEKSKVLAFVYMFDQIAVTIEGEEGAVDRVLHDLRSRAWGTARPKH